MFAIIQNTEKQTLPTVININDQHYPDFIMSGYEEIERGTKREMNTLYEEMIIEYASAVND